MAMQYSEELSKNLPRAFSYAYTGASPDVLEQIMAGASIKEATENELNAQLMGEYGDLLGGMSIDDLLSMDPDAVEKAAYQLHIRTKRGGDFDIDGMMTPWGSGLSEEDVQTIALAYPGIEDGLDMNDIERHFGDAEQFLDRAGLELDDLMDAGMQRAEDEGRLDDLGDLFRGLGDQVGLAGAQRAGAPDEAFGQMLGTMNNMTDDLQGGTMTPDEFDERNEVDIDPVESIRRMRGITLGERWNPTRAPFESEAEQRLVDAINRRLGATAAYGEIQDPEMPPPDMAADFVPQEYIEGLQEEPMYPPMIEGDYGEIIDPSAPVPDMAADFVPEEYIAGIGEAPMYPPMPPAPIAEARADMAGGFDPVAHIASLEAQRMYPQEGGINIADEPRPDMAAGFYPDEYIEGLLEDPQFPMGRLIGWRIDRRPDMAAGFGPDEYIEGMLPGEPSPMYPESILQGEGIPIDPGLIPPPRYIADVPSWEEDYITGLREQPMYPEVTSGIHDAPMTRGDITSPIEMAADFDIDEYIADLQGRPQFPESILQGEGVPIDAGLIRSEEEKRAALELKYPWMKNRMTPEMWEQSEVVARIRAQNEGLTQEQAEINYLKHQMGSGAWGPEARKMEKDYQRYLDGITEFQGIYYSNNQPIPGNKPATREEYWEERGRLDEFNEFADRLEDEDFISPAPVDKTKIGPQPLDKEPVVEGEEVVSTVPPEGEVGKDPVTGKPIVLKDDTQATKEEVEKNAEDAIQRAKDFEVAASTGVDDIRYSENLVKKFYEKIYSIPGAGNTDVQSQLESLFGQTTTLFFLHFGLQAWDDVETIVNANDGVFDMTKFANVEEAGSTAINNLEGSYANFLNQYMADPFAFRSGARFQERLKRVNEILTRESDPAQYGLPSGWSAEDQADHVWIKGLFGGDDDHENRLTLITMAVTGGGQGYYSRQIQQGIRSLMGYYRNTGSTESEIFRKMTDIFGGRGAGVARPSTLATVSDPASISGDIPAGVDPSQFFEYEDSTDGTVREYKAPTELDPSGVQYGRDLTQEETNAAFARIAAEKQAAIDRANAAKEGAVPAPTVPTTSIFPTQLPDHTYQHYQPGRVEHFTQPVVAPLRPQVAYDPNMYDPYSAFDRSGLQFDPREEQQIRKNPWAMFDAGYDPFD